MKVILNKMKDDYKFENIKYRYFSEINIGDEFRFYCKSINENRIKFSSIELVIKSLKFISAINYIPCEEEKVKKLIICGYIDVGFFIEDNYQFFYVKRKIPFNTFIIVPYNAIKDEEVNLNYCIEDITVVNIEYDLVFINIILFLEYVANEAYLKEL